MDILHTFGTAVKPDRLRFIWAGKQYILIPTIGMVLFPLSWKQLIFVVCQITQPWF